MADISSKSRYAEKRMDWDLDIFVIMADLSTCFVSCTFVLDCNSNFKLKA